MKKVAKPRAKPRAAPKPKAAKPKKNPPRQVVSVKINIDNSKKIRGGARKGARGGGPQGLAPYTPPITTYPLFKEDPPPPPILPPLAIERLRMQYPLLAAMANPVEETAMALRPMPPAAAAPPSRRALPPPRYAFPSPSTRRPVKVPSVPPPATPTVGAGAAVRPIAKHPIRNQDVLLDTRESRRKLASGEWVLSNVAGRETIIRVPFADRVRRDVIPAFGGTAVLP